MGEQTLEEEDSQKNESPDSEKKGRLLIRVLQKKGPTIPLHDTLPSKFKKRRGKGKTKQKSRKDVREVVRDHYLLNRGQDDDER